MRMCCLRDQWTCTHCPLHVSLQDARRSRLPILRRASQPAGDVSRPPAPEDLVTQLQGQVLELQGELTEFKVRNRQLQQKLILAEAMMEGRPAPDETLLKGERQEKRVLCERDRRAIELLEASACCLELQ